MRIAGNSKGSEELAWAAGFFDGEGTVGWGAAGKCLFMSISQKDVRPLERFRDAVGVGKVQARIDKSGCQRYEAYSFEQIQAVIAMLWKYLSGPKREQAVTALRAADHFHMTISRFGPSQRSHQMFGKRYRDLTIRQQVDVQNAARRAKYGRRVVVS
jgi:hypothetical protein